MVGGCDHLATGRFECTVKFRNGILKWMKKYDYRRILKSMDVMWSSIKAGHTTKYS